MTAPAKPIPALPGPYSVDGVINRLIGVAGSQVGQHEGHDSSGWNNDVIYAKWYGMNGSAWCAMFVSWCAATAGIPSSVILKHAYTPTGYKWFQDKGEEVSTPKRGDIFYLYSSSQGIVHHVGIVESVSPGYVHTIEGNTNTNGSAQGDGVYRLKRPITSSLRFCRPRYSACVKPAPVKPAAPAAAPKPILDASVLAAQTLNDQADRLNKAHPYKLTPAQATQIKWNRKSIEILLGRKGIKYSDSWSTLALVQIYQRVYLGMTNGKNTGIAYNATSKALAAAAGYQYQD